MIDDVVMVNPADVDDVSFATTVLGPAGMLRILNVAPVIVPDDVDVTFVGVVTRGVPSLIVNENVLVAAKPVPEIVTVVPLGPDTGDSESPEVTVNDVVGVLEPSESVIV